MRRSSRSKIKKKVRLMLDSGAFSAWNRGESLSTEDYIEYVKEHLKYLDSYVNMDVLPGRYGEKYTQKDVEYSASQSYENLQIIKASGLSPLPVYHQGEDWSWLEKLLDDGETHIGISIKKDMAETRGRALIGRQRTWLDQAFRLLSNRNGELFAKVHGFGITTFPLMVRYPWHSVDSTSWSLQAGYGKILVPVYIDGCPDYSQKPLSVVMSGRQQRWGGNKKSQFEAISPKVYESALKFLTEEIGVTAGQARYDDAIRRRAVLKCYVGFAACPREFVFEHRPGSFGGVEDRAIPDLGMSSPYNLRIIYATTVTSRSFSKILTDAGARDRLLSYYDLRNVNDKFLHHYITTGLHPPRKNKVTKRTGWDASSYTKSRRLSFMKRFD